jgi:hypothetical protein
MNRQQQIEHFTLAAHRVLLKRIRADPSLLTEALTVIQRWRDVAGCPSHSDVYWNEWEQLLQQGPEDVEAAVCVDTDHAAVLRSTSPLGRFLEASERASLLLESRLAA